MTETANQAAVDYLLIGGSLISDSIDPIIKLIKKCSSLPLILFPGSLLQISEKADGILLLALISGRNPEYLIGNHVIAAGAGSGDFIALAADATHSVSGNIAVGYDIDLPADPETIQILGNHTLATSAVDQKQVVGPLIVK